MLLGESFVSLPDIVGSDVLLMSGKEVWWEQFPSIFLKFLRLSIEG
jgi:hypothetical protein